MADACRRCDGKGWYWNGRRRVTCREQHTSGHYRLVPREEWPAVMARQIAAADARR
jgi:DnaJ-class molecular chaperone